MEKHPIKRIDDNGDVFAEKDGELICVGTLHPNMVETAKLYMDEENGKKLRKLCGGTNKIKIATIYGQGSFDIEKLTPTE